MAAVNASRFFKLIGIQTNQVKNTMIIGGSKIAVYLARQLTSMRIRVKIIERDRLLNKRAREQRYYRSMMPKKSARSS